MSKAERIENYYGLAAPLTGAELQRIGEAQAAGFGVRFHHEQVIGIGYADGNEDNAEGGGVGGVEGSVGGDTDGVEGGDAGAFFVQTSTERLTARALLITCGASREKVPLDGLDRLEGKGVSYCAVCDGFFYRGKSVGVLGYSDYAVQEAAELTAVTQDVTIFTNGRPLALSPAMQERFSALPIVVVEDAVQAVLGDERFAGLMLADGSTRSLDGLFVAYGVASSGDIAKKMGVALSDKGDILTDGEQATNIPGIFAAGDCTGGFRQVAVAVGQGALAARSIIAYCRTAGS